MIHESMTIPNKLGLHTRAAAKLVKIAKQFSSRIEIAFSGQLVDCKSIMAIITLGAQQYDNVDIMIRGEDEEQAFQAIQILINNKFGEKE